MYRWQGHFDDGIFATLVRSLGVFPVGSLVRLRSGRLALVVDFQRIDTRHPVVRAFYCAERRISLPPIDINLAAPGCGDQIVRSEDPKHWGFTSWDEQWPALVARGIECPRAA